MFSPERGKELLYLSRAQIQALEFSPEEVISAVEVAFRQKATRSVQMPPKPGIHPRPGTFIHAMPAYLPELGVAGMKWVSGFPENHRIGLPYIAGLIILNCPDTGVPLAVMDCTWITEKRTAAATAVAVRPLAVDPRRLAIIGAGVQGRANTDALRRVCPSLRTVAIFDPSDEARANFQREVSAWGLSVEQASSVEVAVHDADVVVTCAFMVEPAKPVIPPEWLKPGAVAAALDFNATFQAATVRAADAMWVDDGPQFEYYRQQGYFKEFPSRYREVAELVTGAGGRTTSRQRHMIVNLGLALEDMATAKAIYHRALERQIGTLLAC